MEWVASTLLTTSEHGVSSITTADAHTSAASSRLNWRLRHYKWTRPFCWKTKFGFWCVCHHISTELYLPCDSDEPPPPRELWEVIANCCRNNLQLIVGYDAYAHHTTLNVGPLASAQKDIIIWNVW